MGIIGVNLSYPQAIPEHAFAISDGTINDRAVASTNGAIENRLEQEAASTNISCGPTPTFASTAYLMTMDCNQKLPKPAQKKIFTVSKQSVFFLRSEKINHLRVKNKQQRKQTITNCIREKKKLCGKRLEKIERNENKYEKTSKKHK